jgi:hypothetical protein
MSTNPASTDPTKKFQEYPALTSTMKDEHGNFHTLRAWSPRPDDPARDADDLRASFTLNAPDGERERHSLDLKAKVHEGRKYFSGKIEREGQSTLLVRIVGVDGKDGRFAAMRVAEFGRDDQGQSEFIAIKGQGGIVRMNPALAELAKVKDPYEVAVIEQQLDVKVHALAPKEKEIDLAPPAPALNTQAQDTGLGM